MQLQRLNLVRGKCSSPCVADYANDEKALDRYEGCPHLYRKEMMKVKVDKKTVNAMVYIMNEGRPLEQPSCYDYLTIIEGANSTRFDIEFS
ncbi:gamma-glutamylcyclotransferase family protein [Oceanobacillus indicireducens]|uniref:Gamma-glutamylcyclotransferase AIG2-like domain-containing protein n=1 Tax=Oceanobacillus indicireducens TaxID=1004261 RepID=A0A918D4K7_9BACI|nr:gamma-glutamylcyclotransferase family protein [Oceanobacillus indicireducens]GGN65035.1 hypothetical protein GCM10007971_33490 [Oceanobacillus indicireducens]